MSLSDSRASSPINCTTADTSVDQAQEHTAKEMKHPQYYFEDGNIVFKVEDTLYNVHRYFFARDSPYFRTIFQKNNETVSCFLPDLTCADFSELLALLYPTDFRQPIKKSTNQWTSILHLAARWGFENIKLLAIDNLTAHASPIDKIVLGQQYDITNWLPGAYESVCMRADPLTVEEGMKLGVEDTVKISATRQLYGTTKACYISRQLSGNVGRIFGLEKPSEIETTSENKEEDETIVLLERQIGEARADCLTHPVPTPEMPLGSCFNHTWVWSGGIVGSSVCCTACSGRFKTEDEAMEKGPAQRKVRKLKDLTAKLESRRQELAREARKAKKANT